MLKGVTGNIGASALHGKVSEIDAELKQGKIPGPTELDEMQTLLQNVMLDIDSLASSPEQTLPPITVLLDPEQLSERLERLDEALNNDLGSAETLFAELRAGVHGTPLEAEIAAIATKFDVFDIEAAQTLLASLRSIGGNQANPDETK